VEYRSVRFLHFPRIRSASRNPAGPSARETKPFLEADAGGADEG
jgi:hypothetical protein